VGAGHSPPNVTLLLSMNSWPCLLERTVSLDTRSFTSLTGGGGNGVVHFYRAPALGCTTLKEVSWDYNQFGFPTRYREWVVTSIEIGEPDPKLFDVPGGYFGLF
jgi:hypothetical protein